MSTFDGHQYEREQSARYKQVVAQLREFVPIDAYGNGPAVEFVCPSGRHGLKRYRVTEHHDETGLYLQPLPGESAAAGPVASEDSPWGAGKHVCDEVGCPTLIDHIGHCDEHGGRRAEFVHHVRTRFKCRACRWSDAFTTARLLQVYGMAVHLGVDSIPVTGAVASARRAP